MSRDEVKSKLYKDTLDVYRLNPKKKPIKPVNLDSDELFDNVLNEIKKTDVSKDNLSNFNNHDSSLTNKLLTEFVDDDIELKFNSESPSPNKSKTYYKPSRPMSALAAINTPNAFC